jgi:plastocyanin
VRRIALLALVLAAWTAAPAAAPAARPKCGKRAACKGKVRAMRAGVPKSWPKRAALPGTGDGPAPGDPAPTPTPAPRIPGAPPPPPPPPPLPTEDPRFVSVSAYDREEPWLLVPSRTQLLSGTVTVQFNNSHAQDPHDLWLRKGGVTHAFDEVAKEETATKQLALTAGTWTLWCNIGDHKERGMLAQVTVTDG